MPRAAGKPWRKHHPYWDSDPPPKPWLHGYVDAVARQCKRSPESADTNPLIQIRWHKAEQSHRGRRVMTDHRRHGLKAAAAAVFGLLAGTAIARADSTITIATVNNGDMVVMQRLSSHF